MSSLRKPSRRALVAGAAAAALVAIGTPAAVMGLAHAAHPAPAGSWVPTPRSAAVTAAGSYLVYVAQPYNGQVRTYDAPAATAASSTATNSATGVAVTPDGLTEYISDTGDYVVRKVDVVTGQQTSILVGFFPGGIAVSPDGSHIYVAQTGGATGPGGSDTVAVISPSSNTVTADIKVGETPREVAFSPDSSRAYVTTATGIYVIDTATSKVTRVIRVSGSPDGPEGLAVSPGGGRIYVTNPDAGTLLEISTATGRVIGRTRAGAEPFGVAASPDGSALYVADTNSNSVAVISAKTGRITKTIAVGELPMGIGITPDGAQVWVADGLNGQMSVISTSSGTVTNTIGGSSPWAGQGMEMAFGLNPQVTLYDFTSGTEGWTAGQNVASVATVTSIANGPGVPTGGPNALQGISDVVPANALRTMSVAPQPALDLSGAATFIAYFDCYGGAPGATGYTATVTLTSGTQTLTQTTAVNSDTWTKLSLDISSWPYSNNITGIEIGFQAVGSDTPWQPAFQLDAIGYIR